MLRSIAFSAVLATAINVSTALFANAATITYTNQAAFAAATSGISFTTVDFEGVAADGSFVFEPTPPGVTLMGANFTIDHSTGNTGILFVIGDDFYYTETRCFRLSNRQRRREQHRHHVSRIGNRAVIEPGNTGCGCVLVVGTFQRRHGRAERPGVQFTGVLWVDVHIPVQHISANGAGETVRQAIESMNIDNVSFGAGDVAAVPEPASMVLIGSALALAGARRRRALRVQD